MGEEDLRLEMLKFYQGQNKIVRDVMDRWFGFYLLIIGAPFPIFVGLLQIPDVGKLIQETPQFLAIVAFFLFSVGLFFLFVQIRQRITAERLLIRLTAIEKSCITELEKSIAGLKGITKYGPESFGADFYFGLVYAFINSTWFAVGSYFSFLECLDSCTRLTLTFLTLIAILTVQVILRHQMIKNGGF